MTSSGRGQSRLAAESFVRDRHIGAKRRGTTLADHCLHDCLVELVGKIPQASRSPASPAHAVSKRMPIPPGSYSRITRATFVFAPLGSVAIPFFDPERDKIIDLSVHRSYLEHV